MPIGNRLRPSNAPLSPLTGPAKPGADDHNHDPKSTSAAAFSSSGGGKLTAGGGRARRLWSARPPPPRVGRWGWGAGCSATIHRAVAGGAEQHAVLGAGDEVITVELRV